MKVIVTVLEEDTDLLQQKFMVIQPLKVVKYVLVIVQFVVEKKSMTVSDNTIQAEGLHSFFKNLGKFSPQTGKNLATNSLKNPGGFLEIGANVATATGIRKPKAALSSLSEVINFYQTGKGLYLR